MCMVYQMIKFKARFKSCDCFVGSTNRLQSTLLYLLLTGTKFSGFYFPSTFGGNNAFSSLKNKLTGTKFTK